MGAGWPQNEIHTFWECRWSVGSWPSVTHLYLHGEKGALRRRDRCDFQGPSLEREEGRLPCPAPGELRLLQSAAAGQNVGGCLPPCLCESRKNKLSDFRLLETNFCGVHTRVHHHSGTPSPRFANLGEWGLESGLLGTEPVLQEGTHLCGKWGLTFKSLWPINKEAKAEDSKGGGALQAQVRYLRDSKSTWRRLLL